MFSSIVYISFPDFALGTRPVIQDVSPLGGNHIRFNKGTRQSSAIVNTPTTWTQYIIQFIISIVSLWCKPLLDRNLYFIIPNCTLGGQVIVSTSAPTTDIVYFVYSELHSTVSVLLNGRDSPAPLWSELFTNYITSVHSSVLNGATAVNDLFTNSLYTLHDSSVGLVTTTYVHLLQFSTSTHNLLYSIVGNTFNFVGDSIYTGVSLLYTSSEVISSYICTCCYNIFYIPTLYFVDSRTTYQRFCDSICRNILIAIVTLSIIIIAFFSLK